MPRYEALCLTLQGLIDQDENRATPAEIKLRSARDIAKTLNDRKLRFQVEFYLFKHAVTQGRKDVARSIKRRLERLALSVPGNTEQLVDFKVLKDKV
jgi:hypothetical protein